MPAQPQISRLLNNVRKNMKYSLRDIVMMTNFHDVLKRIILKIDSENIRDTNGLCIIMCKCLIN